MSNFPWTQEEINELRFREQYKQNVEDCANAIIENLKLYNDDYEMDIFTTDVLKRVGNKIRKIGEWE